MKKILLSILLFYVALFCLPLNVNGTIVELTVTINSLQIPERAEATLIDDRPDTEFILPNATLVVLDRNGDITQPNIDSYNSSFYNYESSGLMYFNKNSFATTAFTYNAELAPYSAVIEIPVTKQEIDSTVFKADCSPHTYLVGGIAWYYTDSSFVIKEIDNEVIDHVCPENACYINACHNNQLAFDPTHIADYGDRWGMSRYIWRSPSIYYINLDL